MKDPLATSKAAAALGIAYEEYLRIQSAPQIVVQINIADLFDSKNQQKVNDNVKFYIVEKEDL